MITKNIKKYLIVGMVSCVIGAATTSCEDMLESDSSRQLFEPALDQKSDSVFYAYGIMQAMQQLADQYYFQNEMRGDLVTPTAQATTDLRDLAQFAATASNKYDSVYLYYKVINNCNYYLEHRKTDLQTGGKDVVSNEYAAVASFRAWAYLQLTRQYGNVPYMTQSVTSIEQINANTAATSYQTVLEGEAEMLEGLKARYSDEALAVPTFGITNEAEGVVIGTLNWKDRRTNNAITKRILPRRCFLPLNVVLGDIYLELGRYAEAAKCYYDYLRYAGEKNPQEIGVSYAMGGGIMTNPFKKNLILPTDFNSTVNTLSFVWYNSFSNSHNSGDVLSYIPMAVNYTNGKTTDIPAAFGYNYYSSDNTSAVEYESSSINYASYQCPNIDAVQVLPSQAYRDSVNNTQYYYMTTKNAVKPFNWIVKSARLGDGRSGIIRQGAGADSTKLYVQKPSTGYVYLYRNTTVWLHLAEAINRMGYPDAAFAILKTGLHTDTKNFVNEAFYLKDYTGENDSLDVDGNKILDPDKDQHTDDSYFLTKESYELLTTTLPFLSQENSTIFANTSTGTYFIGIHEHGACANANTENGSPIYSRFSPYRYSTVLKEKIDDVYAKFGLGTPAYTKADYINAMEDLICDEYAMEFAFEGTRFSDLRRLALHKNGGYTAEQDPNSIYSGNFGDTWLSRMLQNNAPGITTQNCYLPFK